MDKDRKTYTVSLENSVDETYVMSLTDDQVKVFKWLKDVGYDFTITEQGDVIVLQKAFLLLTFYLYYPLIHSPFTTTVNPF